jgi:hypothetical protein
MLISKVKGFEGPCKPTWINKNQIDRKFDGGVSGFFKLVKKRFGFYFKTGKQFHGIVRDGKHVETTELEDLYDDSI